MSAHHWTTSSYAEPADTTPGDLANLHEHVRQCTDPRGRLVALRCGALKLHDLMLGRLVTTLALLMALAGGLILLL